jgi:hypothetical protein
MEIRAIRNLGLDGSTILNSFLATLFNADFVINESVTVERWCHINDTEKPKYWKEKMTHLYFFK